MMISKEGSGVNRMEENVPQSVKMNDQNNIVLEENYCGFKSNL